MSIYMYKLRHWDTSVMSKCSLSIKVILAVYIALIWIWCIYGAITSGLERGSDEYVVILEWNSVMINLFWVLSMVS